MKIIGYLDDNDRVEHVNGEIEGDGFGKFWLCTTGGSYFPPLWVVRSSSMSDAYEAFVSDEKVEEHLKMDPADLAEAEATNPDDISWNDNGTAIDTDNVWMQEIKCERLVWAEVTPEIVDYTIWPDPDREQAVAASAELANVLDQLEKLDESGEGAFLDWIELVNGMLPVVETLLGDKPWPTIPLIGGVEAAHVLFAFDFEREGMEPGTFFKLLIQAIQYADLSNRTRLARLWPNYVSAVSMAQYDADGIQTLKEIVHEWREPARIDLPAAIAELAQMGPPETKED